MKAYEEICVEVVPLDRVDIIRTSDETPVDIGNGDTPAIPAM